MPEFRPAPGGATLVLDDVEALLLRELTAELRALVTDQHSSEDPVVDRLFPAAYDDAKDESAYRDMTGEDLQREKLRALDVVSESIAGGPAEVRITGEDVDTWLACLTDLRLAIGTRLDVNEERMGADIDPGDPDAQALTVLHWLGWLQEGLLSAATSAT